jgi:hypothetical protein
LGPLGDHAACSSLQGRVRLEASLSKAVIKSADRVCDGCREGGRRRPWRRERHGLTDSFFPCPCRQQASSNCIQPQHSVTRWRVGIRSRAADSSMLELEQCATLHLHLPVLDFHMIALGGSSRCYGGASGCGGNGAIFFTCMTGRHDRRAISSHLCCGHCAIRAGWTVGQRPGRIVCWPSVLRGREWSVQEWSRACCRVGRGYLQGLAVVGSQALPRCSAIRAASGGVAGAKPRGAIVASRSASAIAEIRPD